MSQTTGPLSRDSDQYPATHVLSVDDDPKMTELLARYFAEQGFEVSQANSLQAARTALGRRKVDLVLLDLVLLGESGYDMIRELRQSSPEIGVIVITGRTNVLDRVIGLELGADDYIAKPFKLREVLARVRSVMRRLDPTQRTPAARSGRDIVRFEGWTFDLNTRRLTRPNGEEVALTSAEFALLAALVRRPGHVLDRDFLLDSTKGRNWHAFDRSIDAQISRLRKKIEADSRNPALIKSVRGTGYVFAGRVE